MSKDPEDSTDGIEDVATSSPYGPQHGHIDESAGGADSSPFETSSAEERDAALREARKGSSDRTA